MSLDSYLQMNHDEGPQAVLDEAEVERRVAQFKDTCKQAGVRLTPQRLEIFRGVAASLDHPDAEAVFRRIHDRIPTTSLDTVYRTLSLLKDLGLVVALGPRRESVRFDANLRPHHHYVCMRCSMTRDIESPELSVSAIPDAVQELGSVIRTQVEVQGICRACSSKPPGETGTQGEKGVES
jgi:Fur family peroxide stress response transcriptional regulator